MSHPHPGLSAPPALPAHGLRIVALGGIGEIGRNMTVFEHQGRLLVVDCGVLFPDEHQPGVDVIIPDFSWIRHRRCPRAPCASSRSAGSEPSAAT